MSDIVFVPLVLFMVIVAPIWLFLHYGARNSANRRISGKDEALMEDLHSSARSLEERIHTLERILDADSPEWRNRNS
ncbi:MAG: envelope stress response membrane protein PspB [Wenzhouxiangella sp.]|jgi:phage shock protein B|nr:envelope stress response membrane protein PspB [Wenzhouxiangella sp.]